MPPRRRVVKRCRKNVIYFLLRFSPIAQCVSRFWRYNVSTSAQHASVVFSSKYKRDVTKTLSRFHYWEDVKIGFLTFKLCVRRLANVQSFNTLVFRYFCNMNASPARRVTPPWDIYMANAHPTYHVNVIEIKQEILKMGGLPHLGGLRGVPIFM